MQQSHFTVVTKPFEGPFDLLLFFIERDELDIQDIPISKITDDFLQYVQSLEKLNIDIASEFILVAAKLMRIKAKMLLPRKELDEEGNEVDPRQELVQKLLEYKRFKEIIPELNKSADKRGAMVERGNIRKEISSIAQKALVDLELESLTLYKLLSTYQRLLSQIGDKARKIHEVISYPFTIESQQEYILNSIPVDDTANFVTVFGKIETKMEAIVTFLALLELLNSFKVKLSSTENYNNFFLSRT